ncbi:MAG: DegV family protein [Candidatus Heimdallarchaeaceae archaeon]
MNIAIVTDTSREFNSQLLNEFDIFAVGYIVQDSKGRKYKERKTVSEFETGKLKQILKDDKKAQILSPSIKDFVELYTYLGEQFDSVISIHSASITPAVFENALLAKKMVSEVTIDIIDTQTIGSSSGLFLAELAKFLPKAKKINDIRKESINLNRYIHSFVLSRENQLSEIGSKTSKKFNISLSVWKPYHLTHYYHGSWENLNTGRNTRNLIQIIKQKIDVIKTAKEVKNIYYSCSPEFKKDVSHIVKQMDEITIQETEQSLVSYYLLGKHYLDVSFI